MILFELLPVGVVEEMKDDKTAGSDGVRTGALTCIPGDVPRSAGQISQQL